MNRTDVLIIGAGAVGTAIARELSKFQLRITVVDKNEDVGGDASKSNSAIIHTGFDASPGTLESMLVVAANPMYDNITKELDIPFERIGAILAAINQEQFEALGKIKEKSFRNNVYDIKYLTAGQIMAMEPEITPDVLGGLYIPRESIIDPFILVVALAENAIDNGVKFFLSTNVIGIDTDSYGIKLIKTSKGVIKTKYVINAAGLFSDHIAGMVGKCDFKVIPRKGQFVILDKNIPYKVSRIILPLPTKQTKGKLISPTIHGNLLIGPTAEDGEDKLDKSVTRKGLVEIIEGVQKLVPKINMKDAITEYCGLRPTRIPEGYHIDTYEDIKNFVNISGVRSTGLTSSLAISKYIVPLLADMGLDLNYKKDFEPHRIGIKKFSELSTIEKEKLILKDPRYGHMICRCEKVSEAEIVEAIHRQPGAVSIDAVKRRVRAGMGRCGGGFCGSRILDIISTELGIEIEEVRKNEPGSEIIVSRSR